MYNLLLCQHQTQKRVFKMAKIVEERLFLRKMRLHTVHVCKNATTAQIRDSSRYIKDKKFSSVQVDNDVVVTRIK